MMKPYLDKHLIHNTTLACFLLTHFVKEYQAVATESSNSSLLDLPKLLLVLPYAWNEASRTAINGRTTRTSWANVLRNTPVLKHDLQERVAAHAPASIQGLNLATAAGLLIHHQDETGDTISAVPRWPTGTKPRLPDDMQGAANRLAGWYASYTTAQLYNLMFGIPNEIHN